MPLLRRTIATGLAVLVLVGAGTAAVAAPRVADPRGANRLYEAPGFTGDPHAKVVALTFDDGPHPRYTPQILDILRDKGVKATFFMVGREAERHPEIVRRVVAEGHVVANHTWDHPHLEGMAEDRFSFQIDHTNQVLEQVSGQDVVCTRPPYGSSSPATVQRLAAHGQASIVWSADSSDFEKPGVDAIVANSLKGLTPGGIILLHDGGGKREQTVAALPRLIDELRARGYEPVPVCDGRPHKPDAHLDLVESQSPESVRVAGWARDPDTADPVAVRISVDGQVVHEGPASVARGDGQPGFDVTLPAPAGPHRVCVAVVNVGLGSDLDLGCHDRDVLEAPWYDRLGRYLGLLDSSERWEDAPEVLAAAPLEELLDRLVPRDRP